MWTIFRILLPLILQRCLVRQGSRPCVLLRLFCFSWHRISLCNPAWSWIFNPPLAAMLYNLNTYLTKSIYPKSTKDELLFYFWTLIHDIYKWCLASVTMCMMLLSMTVERCSKAIDNHLLVMEAWMNYEKRNCECCSMSSKQNSTVLSDRLVSNRKYVYMLWGSWKAQTASYTLLVINTYKYLIYINV